MSSLLRNKPFGHAPVMNVAGVAISFEWVASLHIRKLSNEERNAFCLVPVFDIIQIQMKLR